MEASRLANLKKTYLRDSMPMDSVTFPPKKISGKAIGRTILATSDSWPTANARAKTGYLESVVHDLITSDRSAHITYYTTLR